jgi:hypothetical protein
VLLASALLIVLGGAAIAWWVVHRLTTDLLRPSAPSRPGAADKDRVLQLLTLFAPGIAAALTDPRSLLAWQPLAVTARTLFPDEFALLDRAAGAPFPFTPDQLQAAHARWTTEWLAWERTHDTTYKLRAAVAEAEIQASGGSASARAKLEESEREKLEVYQRRYEEYVRVAKALHHLNTPPPTKA